MPFVISEEKNCVVSYICFVFCFHQKGRCQEKVGLNATFLVNKL